MAQTHPGLGGTRQALSPSLVLAEEGRTVRVSQAVWAQGDVRQIRLLAEAGS